MRNLGISVLTALLGTSSAYAQTKTVNITVSKNVTHPISKSLYGYMWEDINHSGDGGLYGELIMNRAFQTVEAGNDTAYYAWMPVSGVSLAVTNSSAGVSSALPNSLQVSIPKNAKSPSFANVGYWGFKVQSGWTYNGSFWARSDDYTGSIKVSLRTNSTSSKGKVYATATPAKKVGKKWTKYTFTFKPTSSAPDHNNMFEVELTQSSKAATVYFGMFSLFPPTYKGRENGMRIDLAEAMAGTQPRLWRFPGGNNLEGLSFDSRWKWNETIGPLENRPGRIGNWGYPNTDGLGLIEYMNWAEDLNATVILGVWDGIATANYSDLSTWPIVPQDQLQPYIDDAIHQISFLTDRAEDSEWGALRAKYGRQEPYPLYYVEIGNEDTFQEASYQAYRWNMFRTQLGARFPTIQFLSTANPSAGLTPAYTKIDYHVYQSPNWFTNATEMFDNYPRNGTQFFVGEYAVTAINDTNALPDPSVPEWGRLLYPTIQGASAEAAFMTGFERNSDIVFASAYAPSLQHINSTQWTPDIITFDAQKLVRSASYYNQQLFATNLGTHSLATNPPNANSTAPLFFAASKNENKNTAIIKVSNAGPEAIASTWSLDFKASSPAQATVLAGPGEPSAHNDLENMNVVVPKEATVSVANGNTITHTFPAYSVTVLVLNVTSW